MEIDAGLIKKCGRPHWFVDKFICTYEDLLDKAAAKTECPHWEWKWVKKYLVLDCIFIDKTTIKYFAYPPEQPEDTHIFYGSRAFIVETEEEADHLVAHLNKLN
jgi:hypothetical protein